MRSGRVLATMLVATMAAPAWAQPIAVSVAPAGDPTGAVRRALPGRRFAACQGTWSGGVVQLVVRVEASGAMAVASARSGEETWPFVACVRAVVRRARVARRATASTVAVRVRFPPLGAGPP